MKKIISIFIFSLFLFAEMNNGGDDYVFPDAFMKDNDLIYDKVDIIRTIPKKKKEIKAIKEKPIKAKMEINNEHSKNEAHSAPLVPSITHIAPMPSIPSMTSIYIAPTFAKRKNLNLVGIGIGFLIKDWLNTELLAETSLKDDALQIYYITNEYSVNMLDIRNIRANILGAFSVGGILNKKDNVEKFFFAYGAGAEIEFAINKIKISGTYKFDVLERKDTKSIKSNIYSVKIKFNFPL